MNTPKPSIRTKVGLLPLSEITREDASKMLREARKNKTQYVVCKTESTFCTKAGYTIISNVDLAPAYRIVREIIISA